MIVTPSLPLSNVALIKKGLRRYIIELVSPIRVLSNVALIKKGLRQPLYDIIHMYESFQM